MVLGSGTRVGVSPHADIVRTGQRRNGGTSWVRFDHSTTDGIKNHNSKCSPATIWRHLRGGCRGDGLGYRCMVTVPRSAGHLHSASIQASDQLWNDDGIANSDSSAAGSVLVVEVQRKVKYGQSLCIVGSSASLGNWDAAKSSGAMQWNEGDIWKCEIALEQLVNGAGGDTLEFKCVVVGSTGEIVQWEEGENHFLSLQDLHNCRRTQALISWGKKCEISTVAKGETESAQSPAEAAGSDEEPVGGDIVENGVLESQELERWSGKETVFMQQNEHPRERTGLWNTEGLQGVALSLVAGDREAGR